MATYSPDNQGREWAKYLIFKMGSTMGFSQPFMAGFAGCTIWAFAWLLVPDSSRILFQVPVLNTLLLKADLTMEVLKYFEWAMIIFGTLGGVACWCRVAMICYPKVYDRYKIKAGFRIDN